jgi:hypothetical protein
MCDTTHSLKSTDARSLIFDLHRKFFIFGFAARKKTQTNNFFIFGREMYFLGLLYSVDFMYLEACTVWLALVSICEIDVTSFSEDGRGVK